MLFNNGTASKRQKPLSMRDYVGLLACDGGAHHANTAHRVCSDRTTAFVCSSGPLQTFRGCPGRLTMTQHLKDRNLCVCGTMLGCWPMMAVSIMQTLHTGSDLTGPQRLSAVLACYRPLEGVHVV